MPTCAVVRHVLFEDLGVWADVLAARGYEVTYLEAGSDVLDAAAEADLTIVLGGPIGIGDVARYPFLQAEAAMIGDRIVAEKPVIGVCLGAQLIAAALGGYVRPGEPEIGWGPVALSAAGRKSVLAPLKTAPVLHWHGDRIALRYGGEVLASTESTPIQAFTYGSALGLQFHVEADASRIEQWLIGHSHELAAHGLDPTTIRADATRLGRRAATAGRKVLERYLDQLDKETR